MRVVFDTNLVISGLLWSGSPRRVLRMAADGQIEAVTSEALIDELRDVLQRDKLRKYLQRAAKTPEELVTDYLRYTKMVEPEPDIGDVVRDLDDVKVLAAAVGGNAGYIVSGDEDLLILGNYSGIVILGAKDFAELFKPEG